MNTTRGFQALGFSFRFESNDSTLVEVIDRCYRDMPASDREPNVLRAMTQFDSGAYEITFEAASGGPEVCEPMVFTAGVVSVVAWEVNHRAEESRSSWPVMHATVTAGPRGAVALCGQSHSGKSTIAAAAAQLGWQHLSDDLGPIDAATLCVHPYARPVMLRKGGRDYLDNLPVLAHDYRQFFGDDWFVAASELGATAVLEPVPLAAVVFLEWGDVASLEPMSKAATLHALVLNSTTLASVGEPVFRGLERVAEHVPGYCLRFGHVAEAIDLIQPLVGG